jgi:ABC-type sugar transport system ATPase subunit
MASVTFQNVSLEFGADRVVDDVSLDVRDGELLAIVGSSGAGKSSLLRIAAGLEAPTSGTVLIDDWSMADVPTAKRNVAMVFQDNVLYPFKTVRQNVSFPLEIAHEDADEIERRVNAEARVLAIEQLLDSMPARLSAGHQQLAQAARAMVRVPDVFLMDEPMARLDQHLRGKMRREFRLLQQGYGVTTLFVTNDQADAMAIADRIAVMERGRLHQVGPPLEVYWNPATTAVAAVIGSPPINLVPATVAAGSPGYWLQFGSSRLRAWPEALGAWVGRSVLLGIRPDAIRVDEGGDVVGTLGQVEYQGSHSYLFVELAGTDDTIEVRHDEHGADVGSPLRLAVRSFSLFDPDSGRALAPTAGPGR